MANEDFPPISGTNQHYDPKAGVELGYVGLNGCSVEELLDLRARIDQRLPTASLKSINMGKELVLQLALVKQLQRDTLATRDVPANQMAQVANSVASALATLAKLQVELYDSERLKTIESILIECLQKLPQGAQEEFLEEYERRLGQHG